MNIYRKALDGVFSGLLKGAKNLAIAPLAGAVSGSVLKDIPENILNTVGMKKGLGGLMYNASNAAAQGASMAGISAAKAAPGVAKTLGSGAHKFAKEVAPGLKKGAVNTFKALTVEAPDEAMGRMLRPAVQNTVAGTAVAGGIYAGVKSYNTSKHQVANTENTMPTSGYDGRPNKRQDVENTMGLVQALNDLR